MMVSLQESQIHSKRQSVRNILCMTKMCGPRYKCFQLNFILAGVCIALFVLTLSDSIGPAVMFLCIGIFCAYWSFHYFLTGKVGKQIVCCCCKLPEEEEASKLLQPDSSSRSSNNSSPAEPQMQNVVAQGTVTGCTPPPGENVVVQGTVMGYSPPVMNTAGDAV